MSLLPQERAILAVCEMEADLTIPEIAKRARVAEHIARRIIMKLQDSGIVKRRLYMNSFLLGTSPYLVALALSAQSQNVHSDLHEYLLAQPQVGFIARVSGSYNLFCEVRAENVFTLKNFLDRLSQRFGSIFSDKQILPLTAMNDFPVTANSDERRQSKEFATGLSATKATLGCLDVKILHSLGREWNDSTTALARSLGQPASTIDYHLKKLRSDGIIIGARYFINLLVMKHHFFYHLVSTKGFHQQIRDDLLNFARSEPCCNTFRSLIGRWDVLLECHYETPKESLEFLERLLAHRGGEISGVETLSVLTHEKGSDCTVANT
jgi:DNA-binding Lrp family transcriptional regulator